MTIPENIGAYLMRYASELGDRILQTYPALHIPAIPYQVVSEAYCVFRLPRNDWP